MPDAPTPDFYRYRWQPLASVERAGADELRLGWPDGVTLRAHASWLEESAVGRGIDPATREGIIDPADLADASTAIADATVEEDGALVVTWSDGGGPSRFHPGWLRHVADGLHHPDDWLPPVRPWTAATQPEPPTYDHAAATTTAEVWLAFVDDLVGTGLARLAGCPTDLDTLDRIASRFGPLRDTNFGRVWSVRADPDPDSTANTSLRLGPHTDLPTRETPPGFQFLHCVENTTDGGLSQMTDGMAVAEAIEADEPHHYEALTTLRWVFVNRGPEIDHRWSGPIIDKGVEGSPLTFRAFYPVRAFPDMAPDDVGRAYAALRRFSELAGDPAFQITFGFRPGDLIGFDNRRVLHGRTAFDSARGHRHLRGCYMDHDDVRSSTRVWHRRQNERAR